MKVLFIIQGEGRGHLTQSLTLADMLRENGHEVVEMLVGKSCARQLPAFFLEKAKAPVRRFDSPNFLPSADNRRVSLLRSIGYNIAKAPKYLAAMFFLRRRIRESGADLVVNFYEVLCGLTYGLFRPQVPEVCVGHQYLFLHPEFRFPEGREWQRRFMMAFTRLTAWGSQRLLALSIRRQFDDPSQRLTIVPPLLRREVKDAVRHRGDFITGYLLNAGYSDYVVEWHRRHPEVSLHFFWDNREAGPETRVDQTLTFHQIDDEKFLYYLANCRAYASTAGFESVCEALYMGKPVLMVPVHIEQQCNASDAEREGVGITDDRFSLDRLIRFSRVYMEDGEFRLWENQASQRIIAVLQNVCEDYWLPRVSQPQAPLAVGVACS